MAADDGPKFPTTVGNEASASALESRGTTQEDTVMAREREGPNPQPKSARRSESVLQRIRLGAIAIVAVSALMLPVGTALADTQRLPDAACNQGSLGTGKRGPLPHLHDFDGDSEFGCYHRNPALPSQRGE